MEDLLERIRVFTEIGKITKHDKIVNGIKNTIYEKELKQGDILPSVNELSSQLGFSRETVVKAYKTLKEIGLISSKQGVGYFVAHDKITQKLSIAIVLYGFQTFQQVFYNNLRKTLGEDYQLDVFFHHNNENIYETILSQVKGQYGMYIVAPIQYERGVELLNEFADSQLLIVDRYQYINENASYISQEFELTFTELLLNLQDDIEKYKEAILFYRGDVDYPKGIYKAYKSFCEKTNLLHHVEKEYDVRTLKKDTLYITVGDSDLWELLKDSRSRGYKLGKDIGVLSHNDSPVKEIIEGGISTFSTDFGEMGKKAAHFIKERKRINDLLPMQFIDRKSF